MEAQTFQQMKMSRRDLAERALRKIHELTTDGENLTLDYDPFING